MVKLIATDMDGTLLNSNHEIPKDFKDIIKALKERGIKIPQDISIVGFDDIQTANIIEPQLTTIKQNSYDMGYESASILINNLENKEINNIEKMIFKPELVIRSSTSQNFRGGRL